MTEPDRSEMIVLNATPPILSYQDGQWGQRWWSRRFSTRSNIKAWRWWLVQLLTTADISGFGCAACGAHGPRGFRWPVVYWHQRWFAKHKTMCPGELEGIGE